MPRKPEDLSAAPITEGEFDTLNELIGFVLLLKYPDEKDLTKRGKIFYDRVCEMTGYSIKTVQNWYLPSGKPKISEFNLRHFCVECSKALCHFGDHDAPEKSTFFKKLNAWVNIICEKRKWKNPFVAAVEQSQKAAPSPMSELAEADSNPITNPIINRFEELKRLVPNITKVSNKEVLKSLSTIFDYYVHNHIYRDVRYDLEFDLFHGLLKLIHKRMDLEEEPYFEDIVRQFKDTFLNTQWELFERIGDVIIKRLIYIDPTCRRENYGFDTTCQCGSKETSDRFVWNIKFDILHRSITFCQIGSYQLGIPYPNEIMNFSYNETGSTPEILHGHKVYIRSYIKDRAGNLEARIAILKRTKSRPNYQYQEVHYRDNSIPEYVRAFFTLTPDMDFTPAPFLYLYLTLYEIYSRKETTKR